MGSESSKVTREYTEEYPCPSCHQPGAGYLMCPSRDLKCGICKDGWAPNPEISRGPVNPKLSDGVHDEGLYAGFMDQNRWRVDAESTLAKYGQKQVRRVEGVFGTKVVPSQTGPG